MRKPKLAVLCHYFHPDDVVSAAQFSDLCADLAAQGWEVEALPSNRACREPTRYPAEDEWSGVSIRRVLRPAFAQASPMGRVMSSAWMIASWARRAARWPGSPPDVVVVGTDPVLSVVVAVAVKWFRPQTKVAHWCFDLYPEAAIAAGILSEGSLAVRLVRRLVHRAYESCDLVADLGECMRDRLDAYGIGAREITIPPWAVVEPARPLQADGAMRQEMFGDAPLGLLYSGSFGRAHSSEQLLELAHSLRDSGVAFCFAVRGNRVAALRAAVSPGDINVRFVSFVEGAALEEHLASADVHLASLREEWTGVAIPSKFLGSLASGRPVVFAGSAKSAVGRWIREYEVGWVLDRTSLSDVARAMRDLAASPGALAAMQERCHSVYAKHFARARATARWGRELRALIADPHDRAARPSVSGVHTRP